MSPHHATVIIVIALIANAVVRIIATLGFDILAAYIVHRTGKTTGVAAIGRAVGTLVTARPRPGRSTTHRRVPPSGSRPSGRKANGRCTPERRTRPSGPE